MFPYVLYLQKTKELREFPNTFSVFVSPIEKTSTKDTLYSHFAQYGFVKDVFMPMLKRENMCQGYAFVHFETKEAQQSAAADETQEVR